MKNAFLMFYMFTLFQSCSTDTGKVESPFTVTGEWVLVEMSTSLVGSITTGQDMYWQEKYLLKPDGTFIKTRQTGDEIIQGEGTYTIDDTTADVQNFPELKLAVQFTYDTQSEIIGSCSHNSLQEYLYVYNDLKMRSSWNACDGPSLEYERGK